MFWQIQHLHVTCCLLVSLQLDIAVIAAMNDTELSKYFVVGDRVAVKEFCKRNLTPQVQRTVDRKEALLSKLRAKLEARKRSSEHRIDSHCIVAL